MPRGRPRLPEAEKPCPMSVRLSPLIADEVCRLARRHDQSVYAFLGEVIERVITHHLTRTASSSCYGEQQSSTLSGVLSESPSQGRVRPTP